MLQIDRCITVLVFPDLFVPPPFAHSTPHFVSVVMHQSFVTPPLLLLGLLHSERTKSMFRSSSSLSVKSTDVAMRISHACDTDNFRFAFVNVQSVFSGKAVRQDWIRGRNEYHRVFLVMCVKKISRMFHSFCGEPSLLRLD